LLCHRNIVDVLVNCVGAVINDELGRLLLVKRGHPPGEGLWSLPGGRVEPHEDDVAALEREVSEETGLRVTVAGLIGTVERPGPGTSVYLIRDYRAHVTGGTPVAGDDAADARWWAPADLVRLPLTEGLLEVLTGWGVL
jgi:8-oxo-dGTP diphosphatase